MRGLKCYVAGDELLSVFPMSSGDCYTLLRTVELVESVKQSSFFAVWNTKVKHLLLVELFGVDGTHKRTITGK